MFQKLNALLTRPNIEWQRHIQEAARKSMFTPDAADIQELSGVNVFVYNETQSGQPKHGLLGPEAVFAGFGYTEGTDFVLYKKLLGKETFPFALKIRPDQILGADTPAPSSFIGDPGQVIGEVYTIRPKQLIELDFYMLNTVQFTRERTKIIIPFSIDTKTVEYKTADVFMYVGKPDFWDDQIASPEGKKLFERSTRIFGVKEDTIGSHYTFDWNIESSRG